MTRALIVIDVQNEYVTGNLPIGYPPLETSLPNIGRAMDAATEASIPVVVVQHTSPAAAPIFGEGSDGWGLHDTVASRHRDHLISKTLPSSFAGTDLSEWLRERGVDTVTIAGYMTQHCDESTARDAAHRGLAVEFLSDATGTLALSNSVGALSARSMHEAVLVALQSGFSAVATTDDWIAAVRAGSALDAPNIYTATAAARAERATV